MNWFDFVILSLVGVPMALGFKTGLIKTAASLSGIVIGIILATRFWRQAADVIGIAIEDDRIAQAAGFLAILVLTIVGGWMVAWFARRVLTMLLLGWVDKLGGIAIGAVLGSFGVSTLIYAMETFQFPGAATTLAESTMTPYFRFVVSVLTGISGQLDVQPETLAGS